MTRDQKRQLAALVLCRAADIVEFWGEIAEDLDRAGVTPEDAAECIAGWLRHLPGDSWDRRLPDPGAGRD